MRTAPCLSSQKTTLQALASACAQRCSPAFISQAQLLLTRRRNDQRSVRFGHNLAVPKEKDVLLLGSTFPRQEVLHVKLLSCTSCSPWHERTLSLEHCVIACFTRMPSHVSRSHRSYSQLFTSTSNFSTLSAWCALRRLRASPLSSLGRSGLIASRKRGLSWTKHT